MKNVIYLLAAAFLTGCALHPAAMVIPFVGFVAAMAIATLLISRWEAQARAEAEAEGEPVADDEEELFFEQLPTHEELMARYPKTDGDETSK